MRSPLALIALAALVASVAWLGALLWGDRTIRARNALLLRRGSRTAFDWPPERAPADFRIERAAAPKAIAEAAEAAAGTAGGDWPRALALVAMLVRHARDRGPIRDDLDRTYARIREGYGDCVDYVAVYLAAAAAVGLFARQWAFSFNGYGANGHTFVEVWDRERRTWAFVDPHNNVYAVDAAAPGVPLSGLALQERLAQRPGAVQFVQAGEGRLGWIHPEKLRDYYRRGANEWYLWWGNDVVSRRRGVPAGWIARLSGRLGYRVATLLTSIVALATDGNEAALRSLEGLRRRMLFAAGLATLSGLLLVAGLVVPQPLGAP